MIDFMDYEYQSIEIIDKDLIQKFLDYMWEYWQEDILKFADLKDNIKIENIEMLVIWTYDCREELEHHLCYKDKTVKGYYIDQKILKQWMINNKLACNY